MHGGALELVYGPPSPPQLTMLAATEPKPQDLGRPE